MMPGHNPLDDVYLADPEAAIRYLIFRAEHRPGRWSNVRTMEAGLTVSLRIRPADEETERGEEIRAAVSHATRMPEPADLFLPERYLVHAGLIPGERTAHRERRAIVIELTREQEATAPAHEADSPSQEAATV